MHTIIKNNYPFLFRCLFATNHNQPIPMSEPESDGWADGGCASILHHLIKLFTEPANQCNFQLNCHTVELWP